MPFDGISPIPLRFLAAVGLLPGDLFICIPILLIDSDIVLMFSGKRGCYYLVASDTR